MEEILKELKKELLNKGISLLDLDNKAEEIRRRSRIQIQYVSKNYKYMDKLEEATSLFFILLYFIYYVYCLTL